MNTPHRVLLRYTAIAGVLLGAAVMVARPQVIRTVPTLQELLRANPKAFSDGGRALVYVEGRNTRGDWGSVRALSYDSTWTDGTNRWSVWAPTNGVGVWVATDRNDPIIDAARWPIDRTGSTDVTALLTEAVAAARNRTLIVPEGTYLVSKIAVTNPAALEFRGATLIQAVGQTNFAISVESSDVSVRGVTIDGRLQNPNGIWVAPYKERVDIVRNKIVNMKASDGTTAVYGIYANGGVEVLIELNTITNILGTPDGVIGGFTGNASAIFISSPWGSGPPPPVKVRIAKNRIRDVLPSDDCDAIRVLGSPINWQEWAPVVIEENDVDDAATRGVKLSAGGCVVRANHFRGSLDGSFQATGWISSGGYKGAYAAMGSSYGVGNIWEFNIIEWSNYDHILDLSSNEVHASGTIIRGNIVRQYKGVPYAGTMALEGIGSYQSAATNVVVEGNYIIAKNKGVLSFAPDQKWKVRNNHFFNPGGTGTNRTGAAIVLGASINAYNVGLQADYGVTGNTYEHYAVGMLAYNVTNLDLGTETFIDSGTHTLVRNGVDQAGAAVVYTNQASGGTYAYSLTARHGVFGEAVDLDANGIPMIRRPKGTYDIETTARPIWLRPISSESSVYARQADAGQVAFFDDSKSLSWHDGSAWAYPVRASYGVASGFTTNVWYRIARNQTTGLGTRYGATISIGSNGGSAGTFPTLLAVDMNFGEPTVRVVNVPVDGTLAIALPKAIRVVRDATNETTYVDIQASSTSIAQWAVQVVPDMTGPALFPARMWRVSGLTNVSALAPTEVASLTVNGLSNRVFSISQVGREVAVELNSTNLVVRAPVVDIQGILLNNGSPVSGGGGGGGGTGVVAIAQGGTSQTSAAAAFDALAPTTTRGDLIVRGSTNDIRLAIGKLAAFLASDGVDPAWMTPTRLSQFFDDMIYVSVPSFGGGTVAGSTSNGAGAGATIVASEAGENGILQLNTGSTSTGNNRYQVGANSANSVLFGSALQFAGARVKIPTLSSATDRFAFRFGFYDATAGNAVDGAYFDVTDNVNSGNWILKNYSNSTATTNATAVASVAGSWASLMVVVDAAASAAQYYVDGTLAGTVTGGLPTGAGRETRVTALIEKIGGTAGTNSSNAQLGYVWTGTLYPSER